MSHALDIPPEHHPYEIAADAILLRSGLTSLVAEATDEVYGCGFGDDPLYLWLSTVAVRLDHVAHALSEDATDGASRLRLTATQRELFGIADVDLATLIDPEGTLRSRVRELIAEAEQISVTAEEDGRDDPPAYDGYAAASDGLCDVCNALGDIVADLATGVGSTPPREQDEGVLDFDEPVPADTTDPLLRWLWSTWNRLSHVWGGLTTMACSSYPEPIAREIVTKLIAEANDMGGEAA